MALTTRGAAMRLAVGAAVFVTFTPAIALAEAMDKESSVPEIWAMALVPGVQALPMDGGSGTLTSSAAVRR